MNKISRWLFSPTLAILLLLVFAGSMGVATFIENDFGTSTAWALVYNTWWFEVVMLLLGICFAGNIYKYRLFRKEKISILLFHIAFIVILIGAGVTRYTAYGGVMRIREGERSNVIISSRNFVQVHITNGTTAVVENREIYFSPLKKNDFTIETNFEGKTVTIGYDNFIADAVPEIIDNSKEGTGILELVVSAGNGRETIYLKSGEVQEIGAHRHKITFNKLEEAAINITEVNGQLKMKAPHALDFFIMATQSAGKIDGDSTQNLQLRTLYRSGDFSFVPLSFHPKARIDLVSSSEKPKDNDELKEDVLVVNLAVDGVVEKVNLLYSEGFLPMKHVSKSGDLDITLSYGSMPIVLPFAIELNDFQLERYPGSSSPSSYASEVTVLDKGAIPYRIFMNNVLDHSGYRFFQASYDTDEKGTVLSVNHDSWGTLVSYLGYFLMGLGMFWTLFGKGSRFTDINKELRSLKASRSIAAFLLLLLSAFCFQANANSSIPDGLAQRMEKYRIDQDHAALFGRVMVQDIDGRIKPINTLASEFIRKISRRTNFKYESKEGNVLFDANQTFLAIHVNPEVWQKIPFIKIDKEKGGKLFEGLVPTNQGLVSFNSLLGKNGNYLLAEAVETANTKKPALRSEFDKEMLLVDERFNILFNVFSGNYLKVFPKKNDDTKTWYSYTHDFEDFPDEDKQFLKNIVPVYFGAIDKARLDGDWSKAENQLAYIKLYQNVLAEDVIPNSNLVEAELLYNQLNMNFWLFQVFWIFGFVLLVLAVVRIFSDKIFAEYASNLFVILSLIAFIAFTANIALRWYIAQHAPWSNGYEMIVFVSWMLLFSGIVAYKKSDFALPLAALFSGTLLFVSYLDWLSPEITNLMPVLKSYWLKIHVAIIVSSYAPLALSAVLGTMALLLMILKNQKRAAEIHIRIKELTLINEKSMTIGLFLLAVGTFLGGVWANESWGRYWAWDPKETWALISVIVYAAVLHLRFIPKLRNLYTLNTASIFAFSSIVMTSFGVNYYLSGLHSYASGDPLPIPKFIYVIIAIIVLIAVIAFIRNRSMSSSKAIS